LPLNELWVNFSAPLGSALTFTVDPPPAVAGFDFVDVDACVVLLPLLLLPQPVTAVARMATGITAAAIKRERNMDLLSPGR